MLGVKGCLGPKLQGSHGTGQHPQHCQHHPQDADDADDAGSTIPLGGGWGVRGPGTGTYIYIYIFISANGRPLSRDVQLCL